MKTYSMFLSLSFFTFFALSAQAASSGSADGLYAHSAALKSDKFCLLRLKTDSAKKRFGLTWVSNPHTLYYCPDEGQYEQYSISSQDSSEGTGLSKLSGDGKKIEINKMRILGDGLIEFYSETCDMNERAEKTNCMAQQGTSWRYSSPYKDVPAKYFYMEYYASSDNQNAACSMAENAAAQAALQACQNYRGGIYKTCALQSGRAYSWSNGGSCTVGKIAEVL